MIEANWRRLEEQAKKNNPNMPIRELPYRDNHIVGEYNGLNNGNVLYVD